jgi:hypothetical protein
MRIRRFNKAGLREFSDALETIREIPNAEIPSKLIADPTLSEAVSPIVELSDSAPRFITRRDASEFLHNLLAPIDTHLLEKDEGIWSWLSLVLFDCVCPTIDGKRAVRASYTYILDSSNLRVASRHLLHLAWRVPIVAPHHNRLFLDTSFGSVDSFTDKVMKNLQLTRIPCIFEVLDRIYWDKRANRPRRGMVHSSVVAAGDLTHRFPLRISQLELTYDLHSLTADQLIELLGREFQFADSNTASSNGN